MAVREFSGHFLALLRMKRNGINWRKASAYELVRFMWSDSIERASYERMVIGEPRRKRSPGEKNRRDLPYDRSDIGKNDPPKWVGSGLLGMWSKDHGNGKLYVRRR